MTPSLAFWFDLENLPDVLFFQPIAERLRELGHRVFCTARRYSDVPEVARLYGLSCDIVGSYGGAHKLMKVAIGLLRGVQLASWARGRGVSLAAGFGSRPLAVACGLMRLTNATIFDYEHVSTSALARFCTAIFVPPEVPEAYYITRGIPLDKLVRYVGLKEETYTGLFSPKPGLRQELGLDTERVVAVVRPPATMAHYHEHSSEALCRRVLERIAASPKVQAVLLVREGDSSFDAFCSHSNIRRLERPVRGLDLIACADKVFSGGGTMVREAVSLGVPAYSFFTGRQGAVDQELIQSGRLVQLKRVEDVDRIVFSKRAGGPVQAQSNPTARDFFVDSFVTLARTGHLP